ncbi:MAG: biopolymer transporter ExbD [Flavobacteriales bacterium]|nr:biopolymer transporter ExbD [Flavobacteriales bacterium]
MTDLVFLLLIFFVIISTMVSPTTLPVDLPISANKTKEKPRVGVRIDADGNFSVNERPTRRSAGPRRCTAGQDRQWANHPSC